MLIFVILNIPHLKVNGAFFINVHFILIKGCINFFKALSVLQQ